MDEMRDGTIKEVLEKLRRLSYEIEEIHTQRLKLIVQATPSKT